MSDERIQKTLISFVVGFRIIDIADETEGFFALLDQMLRDAGDAVRAFHQKQIPVQLGRRDVRGRVQKDLRYDREASRRTSCSSYTFITIMPCVLPFVRDAGRV